MARGSIPPASASLAWADWPPDVPRPTQEQWEAAVERHYAENDAFFEEARAAGKPYMGDCGYSLEFDMATCTRATWWHYFFP